MNDTETVVEVSHLTRQFRGTRALDDVSLRIARDSITGLLGRNGAGKTTLMSLLTGQDFPTSGRIRVFGEDPLENAPVLARTCFVRENQQYPNNFRVHHVLSACANFHDSWDRDLAAILLADFDLPRNREVSKLSRGMRSALGILVGLASRAPLTIFDEPYLGLDATARQQFYDALLKDYAEKPRTIVLSTHLIDEVSGMLEEVVVLDNGRLALSGSADDLRGRACVLSGPIEAVESLVAALPVLNREQMGGHEAVTVEVRPDQALRSRIAGMGVEISAVSLQTIVVQAGLAARRSQAASTTEGGRR
ncbi:MAG: transporter ATP-binding protein [Marmoricola sp.]|nr:transporter ATP-binding protein [Marmoricola sp.]